MGTGLLATLVVGTIMVQIGTLLNLSLLNEVGGFAKVFMAAAIGVGVTYALNAKPLVILHVILPAVFSLVVSKVMHQKGLIEQADLKWCLN